MGVPVKNFFYHVIRHRDFLGDQGFLAMSAAATGVYFRLRLLAADTNNNGSIRIGKVTMDRDYLVDWVMSTFRLSKREVMKLIQELENSEHVKITPAGKVLLPRYAKEVTEPVTPGAARMRRFRDRQRGADRPPSDPPTTHDDDHDGHFDTEYEGENDTSHLRRRSVTGDGGVTQLVSSIEKIVDINRSRTSSTTVTTPTTTGGSEGGRSGGAPACGWESLRELNLLNTDPIEAYCMLTGERGAREVNGARKKFNEVGPGIWFAALAEVKDAMFAGRCKRPGSLVHHVCNRIVEEEADKRAKQGRQAAAGGEG